MSSHLLLFTPSMLHACFTFFPLFILLYISTNYCYLRFLNHLSVMVIIPCVTGYMISGNTISAMEEYGNDLANSVMERAEATCKNLNPANNVCSLLSLFSLFLPSYNLFFCHVVLSIEKLLHDRSGTMEVLTNFYFVTYMKNIIKCHMKIN